MYSSDFSGIDRKKNRKQGKKRTRTNKPRTITIYNSYSVSFSPPSNLKQWWFNKPPLNYGSFVSASKPVKVSITASIATDVRTVAKSTFPCMNNDNYMRYERYISSMSCEK